MMMLSKEQRAQIEQVLGRALYDQDLATVSDFRAISSAQAANARILRKYDPALCVVYLMVCVPCGSLKLAHVWISNDESLERRQP